MPTSSGLWTLHPPKVPFLLLLQKAAFLPSVHSAEKQELTWTLTWLCSHVPPIACPFVSTAAPSGGCYLPRPL